MAFNSPFFVFLFAPAFFLAYLWVGERWKNTVCLIGSLLFYFWAEPLFALVVIASSFVDHVAVKRIAASRDERARKWLAGLALAQGLVLLLYFKYAGFLYATVAQALGTDALGPGWLTPALPLAISFVTFEKITYVVDVYRGIGRPAARFADYLTYVFLFPKLIAGPIIKYHDIEDALANREITVVDMRQGLMRFAAGLAKKMLIADALAPYADAAFAGSPDRLLAGDAWIGLIAFTFQIYFDFSAYSDMAIGLSRMMGFRLKENFDQPYLSIGFTTFWRRWHISLSTWIRDYLYIPMGGGRVAPAKIYRNLVVCFVLSGLWHGANLTFVVWGLFHGLFLVADRFGFARGLETAFGRIGGIFATLLLVMIGWVFFRAPDIAHAIGYLAALVTPGRNVPPQVFFDQNFLVAFCAAALFSFVPWRRAHLLVGEGWLSERLPQPVSWLIVAGFVWGTARMLAVDFTPFLYFRF